MNGFSAPASKRHLGISPRLGPVGNVVGASGANAGANATRNVGGRAVGRSDVRPPMFGASAVRTGDGSRSHVAHWANPQEQRNSINAGDGSQKSWMPYSMSNAQSVPPLGAASLSAPGDGAAAQPWSDMAIFQPQWGQARGIRLLVTNLGIRALMKRTGGAVATRITIAGP